MVIRTLETILKEMKDLPEFVGINIKDANTIGNFNNYPLHIAVSQGDIEAAQVLIANGAKINVKGEEGYTPLHDAIEQKNDKMIQLLLRNGADIKLQNDDGVSAENFAKIISQP